MTYRIPDDDCLSEAIFIVMYRNHQIESQNEMVSLVSKELNRNGDDYRVSGRRIRYLGIKRELFTISIDYNDTGAERPDKCPVCGNSLKSVYNGTLDGSTIEVQRKCTLCPFSVGMTNRRPGKYTFTKKKR